MSRAPIIVERVDRLSTQEEVQLALVIVLKQEERPNEEALSLDVVSLSLADIEGLESDDLAFVLDVLDMDKGTLN